ncbi:hypothetical protein Hanom_Chr11g00985901 [Helianthus anomalus]
MINGDSTNAIGSLTDLRCEFLLADEKSKNSSIQFGACAAADDIIWYGNDGQLFAIVGTFGGNCAIFTI